MAITRVGALQGAAAVNTATGTAAIDVGALSLQEDDLLIVAVARGDPLRPGTATNLNISASASESGALTELGSPYRDYVNDTSLWVGYAAQGASADTTITVSGLGSVAGYCAYIVIQYRGAASAFNSVSADNDHSDDANPDPITIATSGAKVVAVYAASQTTSTAWTAPGNIDNFIQQTDNGKGRLGVGDADGGTPPTSFNPAAVTGGDASSNDSWAAVTLTLTPAPPTLRPTKLTNTTTFYGAAIGSGLIVLTAELLTEEQSFPTGTVVSGIAIAPEILITESQTFFDVTARGPGWWLSSARPSGWLRVTGDNLPFDATIFDLDIFDGSGAFTVQATPDSNWTRQR